MSSRGLNTRFVKSNRRSKGPGPVNPTGLNESVLSTDATSMGRRFEDAKVIDQLDSNMGFDRYEGGPKKVGWLVNMHSVSGF